MLCESEQQLALWKTAQARGEEVRLATTVRVDGSSYRKPGARMLVTRSGMHAGMVSGGCLEAEICRKIWWLTERGAHVERYVTTYDRENRVAAGLGCGGSIDVLFERDRAASMAMKAVRASIEERRASVILSVVESEHPELRVGIYGVVHDGSREEFQTAVVRQQRMHERAEADLGRIALDALAQRASSNRTVLINGHEAQVFVEYLGRPPALVVFGAGDDAKPVVALGRMMGWHVIVADLRSQLTTRERFPGASLLVTLKKNELLGDVGISECDAAVLMTHSYEQDRELLRELLQEGTERSLKYIGILGARRRTKQLVEEAAASLSLGFEDCMARLHSPVGLSLGATAPETIALSIVAEIQGAIGADPATSTQTDRLRRGERLSADSAAARAAANAAARG
jgi:xanthine/CO dehydrogenase XdhC/CoxF family maturation factor